MPRRGANHIDLGQIEKKPLTYIITLIVVIFMYMKKAVIRSLSSRPRTASWFTATLELTAGGVVAVLDGMTLYEISALV